MKTKRIGFGSGARLETKASTGFTLAELLVAISVFTLMMAGIFQLNIFSVRATIGVSKQLELSGQTDVVMFLTRDVKSATQATIQNYNGSTFTSIPVGQLQQGNALYLKTQVGAGPLQDVQYWVDSQGQLWRSVAGISDFWLGDITAPAVFSETDYTGAIVTIPTARMLVDVNLSIKDNKLIYYTLPILIHTAIEKRN